MQFEQKFIDKMKQWYRDRDGTELSDHEANEAWNNLCGFFELLHEIDQRVKKEDSAAAQAMPVKDN